MVRLVLRPILALSFQMMIDRTCQGRDVTGETTGVSWSSIGCVIKVKVGRYYWRQISRQDVVMVISMDSEANFWV